ncbi:hypothetical protein JCM10213v2_005430, partial [Rhodosporidiobolus nylandii]
MKDMWREVRELKGGSAPLATPPLKKSDRTYATDDAGKLAVFRPALVPQPKAQEALEEEREEDEDVSVEASGQHTALVALSNALPHSHTRCGNVAPEAARGGAQRGALLIAPLHGPQRPWPPQCLPPAPLARSLHPTRPPSSRAVVSSVGNLPRSWRDAVGFVLREPKKPDYSNHKAYRLISFERTLAKPFHSGGRRGVSAEEAVVCAADTVK